MTRTRNGSAVKVSVDETLVDAPTFARVLREITQNLNALFDIATGSNNATSIPPIVQTMTHDGTEGAGALIGLPLWNQCMVRVDVSMPEADVASYGGDCYIAAAPVFIPAGHSSGWVVQLTMNGPINGVVLEIYDDVTGGLVQTLAMEEMADGSAWRAYPPVFSDTSRWFHFCFRSSINFSAKWLSSIHVYHPDIATAVGVPDLDSSPLAVPTAAAGQPINFETLHDEMFTANYAVPGSVVMTLNRDIAALWEAATGGPVPGNSLVTNADTSDVNPTTSRFLAKTRTGWTSEPLCDWPIASKALGAVRYDGAPVVNNPAPPTLGCTTWHAPFARAVATSIGDSMRVALPDFINGASSYLEACVLCANQTAKGTPTNWSFRVSTVAGSSAFVAVTQIGATPFYRAKITAVPFTPDSLEICNLETQSVGAFTFGELSVLGWGLAFNSVP